MPGACSISRSARSTCVGVRTSEWICSMEWVCLYWAAAARPTLMSVSPVASETRCRWKYRFVATVRNPVGDGGQLAFPAPLRIRTYRYHEIDQPRSVLWTAASPRPKNLFDQEKSTGLAQSGSERR